MDNFGLFIVTLIIAGFILMNLPKRKATKQDKRDVKIYVSTAILPNGTTVTAKEGRRMGVRLEWEKEKSKR